MIKTQQRPLKYDFISLPKSKSSKLPYFAEQRYSYGLERFEADFKKILGFDITDLYESRLRIIVEYFYFDAPYTFITKDYQIVIDPSPIHSLTELNYYLRQQNYLVLADFEIYKFTDLTEYRQANLLEQIMAKVIQTHPQHNSRMLNHSF